MPELPGTMDAAVSRVTGALRDVKVRLEDAAVEQEVARRRGDRAAENRWRVRAAQLRDRRTALLGECRRYGVDVTSLQWAVEPTTAGSR